MSFYREHERVIQEVGEESMTKQSHKDECDIYNILAQFNRTNIFTHVNNNQPLYETLPDPIDYQQSLNTLIEAENAFATLSSAVRDRYGNNPALFLQALQDTDQHEYLRKEGILAPLPEEGTPTPTAPIAKAAAGSPPAKINTPAPQGAGEA